MRSTSHGSVLEALCGVMGSEKSALAQSEAVAYFEAVNSALEWAWEAYDWPEITTIKAVTCVRYPGDEWPWVPWAALAEHETWPDTAGTPLGAWPENPLLHPDAPCLEMRVVEHGLWLGGPMNWSADNSGAPVWVHLRRRAPAWACDLWQEGVSYPVQGVVYDWDAGRGYFAKELTTGRILSNTAAWRPLEFPHVLRRVVIAKAHAILLGGREGQASAAARKEQEALLTLQEMIRVDAVQQRQQKQWRAA